MIRFKIGDVVLLTEDKGIKYKRKLSFDKAFKKCKYLTKEDFWTFVYYHQETIGVKQTIVSINNDGFYYTDFYYKNPISNTIEQFWFEPNESYAKDLVKIDTQKHII